MNKDRLLIALQERIAQANEAVEQAQKNQNDLDEQYHTGARGALSEFYAWLQQQPQ
jgi:hypothetical protein